MTNRPVKRLPPGSLPKGISIAHLTDCPECEAEWFYMVGDDQFTRLISVYSRGQDRTVGWRCPDCGHEWPRDFRVEV